MKISDTQKLIVLIIFLVGAAYFLNSFAGKNDSGTGLSSDFNSVNIVGEMDKSSESTQSALTDADSLESEGMQGVSDQVKDIFLLEKILNQIRIAAELPEGPKGDPQEVSIKTKMDDPLSKENFSGYILLLSRNDTKIVTVDSKVDKTLRDIGFIAQDTTPPSFSQSSIVKYVRYISDTIECIMDIENNDLKGIVEVGIGCRTVNTVQLPGESGKTENAPGTGQASNESSDLPDGADDDSKKDGNLIGGDRDEYGCLGPAGYSYDEDVGACTKDWELEGEDKLEAAKIAVNYLDDEKLTIISVDEKSCDGCYEVVIEKGEDREKFVVEIKDGEVVE